MSLPKVTVTLRETNPNYVPKYRDGEVRPYNMDEYQSDYEIEVEIVQLNLNTAGMRVRYQWPSKQTKSGFVTQSRDISIDHFYKQFDIVEK
jgi:hypothetical protein